jgi:hypothetical protein
MNATVYPIAVNKYKNLNKVVDRELKRKAIPPMRAGKDKIVKETKVSKRKPIKKDWRINEILLSVILFKASVLQENRIRRNTPKYNIDSK